MITLTPNLFSDEWIEKYGENSIQKYSEFMKEYRNSNYSYSFYRDFENKLKKEFEQKNKYQLQHFSIIFQSFFPIFQKNIEFDMMMNNSSLSKLKIKNKNDNEKISQKFTKNNQKYHLSFDITLQKEDKNDLLYIEWKVSTNTNKKYKYIWGSNTTFQSLIKKLPIPFDIQLLQNNLQPLSIYPSVSSELIKILDYILNSPFSQNISLFQQFHLILKKLKKNLSIQHDIHLSLIQNLHQYIIDYINQFIQMDINYIKQIRLLYQSFSFYGRIREYSSSFHYEENDFPKLLGKKYVNSHDKNLIHFVTNILKCTEIFYRLYLFSQLTHQDYLYSILWNQMNPFIFQNEKIDINTFFIENIEEYFEFKEKWFSYFESSHKEMIYEEPFLMKTGLFLNVPYILQYPTDPIVHTQLTYLPQLQNSNKHILSSFLQKLSLSKKYQEYNQEYQNLYEYYLQNEKSSFSWKKVNHQNLYGSKEPSTKNPNNFIEKEKEFKQYFQIYEDISLNVLNRKVEPTKYAYCTLLYGNNQYFLDAITFGYSLYMSGTSYDRVLLCTKDVPTESKKQLSRFYNRIFIINELEVDDRLFLTKNRWYGVFNKIYAFYLDEYEKILLTDTDMLIQKSENPVNFTKYPSYCPLDELFEKVNTPAGMCYHENYITTTNEKIPEKIFEKYSKEHVSTISAGMLLIKPSKNTFYDMIYKLHPNTQTDFIKVPCKFPEEGFLSQYFKGEWKSLSVIYNYAPIWLNSESALGFKQREKLYKIQEDEIKVIHYGGYKPWIYLKSPQFFILEKVIQTNFYIKVNMYWYLQFIELEKLCNLPSDGIIAESVPSLRYYCNWDDIKFY